MSYYCLECLNKMETLKNNPLKEIDVVMYYDICEGCGRMVRCVERFRSFPEKLLWIGEKIVVYIKSKRKKKTLPRA